MKIKLSILAIAIIFFCVKTQAQTDTTLKKLLLINYKAYKGHTVDSLVKALPPNYIGMKVLPSGRPEYGDMLYVSYANDVVVKIQVKVSTFKYMNPLLNFSKPIQGQWDVNLFKKEKINYSIVYQLSTCWSGCENDSRSYK